MSRFFKEENILDATIDMKVSSEFPRILGFTVSGQVLYQPKQDETKHISVELVEEQDFCERFKEEVKQGWHKAQKSFKKHYES